jgi:Fic family protein
VKVILPRRGITAIHKKEVGFDELNRLFQIADEITMKDIIQQLQVSKATATRMISHWLTEGKIFRKGRGPATRYTLKR